MGQELVTCGCVVRAPCVSVCDRGRNLLFGFPRHCGSVDDGWGTARDAVLPQPHIFLTFAVPILPRATTHETALPLPVCVVCVRSCMCGRGGVFFAFACALVSLCDLLKRLCVCWCACLWKVVILLYIEFALFFVVERGVMRAEGRCGGAEVYVVEL